MWQQVGETGIVARSRGETKMSMLLIDYPKNSLLGPTTNMVYMDYPSCHTMGGVEELLNVLGGNL